ncbi:protein kinase domain-containing protein [Actinokineospora sp.]|uniref:protein kinase domain-containing protein n=1 Tax=Actinokineospora sp. TaxID=1872133 RepID=UPI0040376A4B
MKLGQSINGYRIVTKPGNANAGKCVWAFAEKDGEEFFVKEFLDPRRPRPDGMGSPAEKARRFAECQEFERRHRSVRDRIRPDDLDAGNLVLAVDFFADGTRYYKITRRVHAVEEVAPHELGPARQGVLLGTLADSLRLLHRLRIVHGDLKPENVLVHQPVGSDLQVAKLIDFDDAYLAGDPPARTVIGGNVLFGAPEWLRYLHGDTTVPARSLTTAADMFAFGLMTHVYVTGELPTHEAAFASPAEAVTAGTCLAWHPRIGPALARLLTELTDRDPDSRPRIDDVAIRLEDESYLRPPHSNRSPAAARRRSRLRVNVTGRTP